MKNIRYRLMRVYDLIRYDIPNFIRNIWIFRSELTNYHPCDYEHSLRLLKKSLTRSCDYIENYGKEENESRSKKVYYMRRCIYLLDCIINDSFSNLAEKNLGLNHSSNGFKFEETIIDGEKYYEMIDLRTEEEISTDDAIMTESRKIEKETWIELFDILKGDNFDYDYIIDPNLKNKSYEEIHTGRGLINWWD